MNFARLTMPPFHTTLMGVLRGVLDHFGLGASDAMLFGGSGHAFLMNVHEQLCPSGPYCWKYDGFLALLRNLGVEMTDLGFFGGESTAAERAAIEGRIRDFLEHGVPCSLLNLENQLITGFDGTGFLTCQPWPGMDFPPGRLSFGTWAELGKDVPVRFFSFRKIEPSGKRDTIEKSLRFALDLHRHPSRYTDKPYAVGAEAYAAWIGAVEKGFGASHGNWWNGTVWAECRGMASAYFAEIADSHPEAASDARALAAGYAAIAEALARAADKTLEPRAKIDLLRAAGSRESAGLAKIEAVAAALAR